MGYNSWTQGGSHICKLTEHNDLEFYWEEYNDIDEFSTDIYWELRLTADEEGYISFDLGSKSLELRILMNDNNSWNILPYTVNLGISNNTKKLLASGTVKDINHYSDGYGQSVFSYVLTVNDTIGGTYIKEIKDSDTLTFTEISSVTFAAITGEPIFGKELTFTLSRFNQYDSTISDHVEFRCGSKSGSIAYNTKDKILKWTIPTSFYNELSATQSEIECDFIITTFKYFGVQGKAYTVGERIITKKLTVDPELCMPVIEYQDGINASWYEGVYFYDTDEKTTALTLNSQKIIKGFNKVHCDLKATAQKGAYITSFVIENEGSMVASDSNGTATAKRLTKDFSNLNGGSFTVKATDSRGFTTRATHYLKTVDYTKLTCAINDLTFNDDTGTATVKIDGKFFKGMFDTDLPYDGVTNTLTIQYRYRLNIDSYGDWSTVYSGDGSAVSNGYNSYASEINIPGIDPNYAHFVQVRVADKLMEIVLDEQSVSITPIFNWGRGDFQFNVPTNFEKGAYITGQPVNDFVVASGTAEMGTNGTWYWQKWNSGRSECYGCRNYGNAAVTTAWGVLYRSEVFNQDLPSGVFLNMPDVVDISFRNSNFGAWIAKHETAAPTETTTGSFIIVRPASATLSQAKISFNVIGRWK